MQAAIPRMDVQGTPMSYPTFLLFCTMHCLKSAEDQVTFGTNGNSGTDSCVGDNTASPVWCNGTNPVSRRRQTSSCQESRRQPQACCSLGNQEGNTKKGSASDSQCPSSGVDEASENQGSP